MRVPRGAALAVGALLAACSAQPGATPAVGESPSSEPTYTALSLPSKSAAAGPSPAVAAGTGSALLATLPVKGRAPMTGYARALFGARWSDVDRNGCDTRNDMLTRDLKARVYKPGTHGCVVLSGDLTPDPYTGTSIHFVRGGASEVDVDHVVALGNAWATGAFRWTVEQRRALANDPLELLVVDSSANRQKGDGDAATWLPPYKRFRCGYVMRQIAVKAKYHLWITQAEHDALARVLARCE